MKKDEILGCEIEIHNDREDVFVRVMKNEFRAYEKCYREEKSLVLRAAFKNSDIYRRLEGFLWCMYYLKMVVDRDVFSPHEMLHELMSMWNQMDGIIGDEENVDKTV